ncbi:MAG: MaoC family dehydratase N-terminal domain-containing protein [Jiangellaceae bacterium]
MSQSTEAAPSSSSAFLEADIEQARSLIGLDFATSLPEHLTSATHDTLRNFAESYGDPNPLFGDEEYGDQTRWRSQIAPPLIGVAVNKPLLGDKRTPEQRRPSFRNIHVFISGSSWDLYRPVKPGDTLYQFEGYENVEVKESEFAGTSVIITRRHVRMNQHAEVVSVARMIAIHAERKSATDREQSGGKPLEFSTYTSDDIAAIDVLYDAETIRGADKRYYEDVQIGDSLGPMAKGPLTTTDIVVFHAGGYGFTPYKICTGRIAYENRKRIAPFYVPNEAGIPDVAQRVHWDNDWARKIGTARSYDYGIQRDCWLTHLLTDWMGDDAWLVRYSSQMRKFNYHGDWHLLTGEIVGKRTENGNHVVDVELRGTNQRGEVTCPATATIALPTREGGEVALPEVPEEIAAQARAMMDRHLELKAASRKS